MADNEETVELNEEEGVTFLDNPDGTPAEPPPEEEDLEEGKKSESEEEEGKKSESEEEEGKKSESEEEEGKKSESEEGKSPEEKEKPKRNKTDFHTRINQLTRRAHENEERAAAAEARNELLEKQLKEFQEKTTASTTEMLTRQEEQLEEAKNAAIKEGDLAAYDRASEQLFQIKLQKQQPTPSVDVPPPASSDDGIHPDAQAWIDANPWYTDPANKLLAREAEMIENQLRSGGMEMGPELYKKLDERLDEFPEFDRVRGTGNHQQQTVDGEQPKPTTAPPTNGGEPPPPDNSGKKGQLTKYDIETMKRFNLDPKDPEHRKAYLARKSKARSAA